MLDLAWYLEVNLPGTRAAFRAGILSRDKAAVIAAATALLDPGEARAAEAMVLGRAGSLTPGALRAAISRAVMEVNPEKAKKRREHMAQRTRVERWAEDSGNAGLAGRELPPAEVLAADQRVTAWARQLRQAGLEGDMDQLRARAFMDLLLGTDSRPPGQQPGQPRRPGQRHARLRGDPQDRGPGPIRAARARHPGTGRAGGRGDPARVRRPGHPDHPRYHPARPRGPARGNGRYRPHRPRPGPGPGRRRGPQRPVDLVRDGHRQPGARHRARLRPARTRQPGQTTTNPAHRTGLIRPADHRSPSPPPGSPARPAGYGTWRFSTGIPGQRDLLLAIGPIPTGECDHRHEAQGHDPGVMLRHLSQVRHATCTGPGCRRPAANCDFEHNIPYQAGGRTCMCNGNPKCRFDHRLKQDPRWAADQLPSGEIRWTTPSGRQYVTEPTRYPI